MNIRVEIEYTSQDTAGLQVQASNYNRVSSFAGGDYEASILNNKNSNYKRVILGKTKLGEAYYSGDYNGLWGNVGSSSELYDQSDSTKGYKINNSENEFVINISGSGIEYFKIIFDKNNDIYAKMIAVNNQIYYNNSIEYEWRGEPADVLTIKILSLNQSNVPVLIGSLLFNSIVEYTEANGLISVVRGSQSSADNVLPEYAIVSQYGRVVFNDFNDIVSNLIKINKFNKTLTVRIYNGDIILGTYETSEDWDYNIFSKDIDVALQDKILRWQSITVDKKAISYDLTANDVYEYLRDLSIGFTFNVSRETIEFWLSINVPYFYLETDTLWGQWNKFLQLTQSVLYALPNGEITIKRRV